MKDTLLNGFWGLAFLAFCLATQTSRAVILFGSGDPSCNTTPPTGALQDSGWQYEGQWGGYLGTPIAPQYFIAAHHVGGSIGKTFTFNGVSYTTTAYWDDPNSDLRIWKVSGTFPTYTPLYRTNDENGKNLVVIGRGTQRGAPVTVTETQTQTNGSGQLVTNTVAVLRGWRAGAADGVMRWGQNQVCYAAGSLLIAAFTGTQGTNEAYLSSGDSSGAVFIQDGSGAWRLAGINYGIDGPFSTTPAGSAFYGAIFDESGLYVCGWLTPDDGVAQPSYFYVTRVSSEMTWIQSIVGIVPPASSISQGTAGSASPPLLGIQASGQNVIVSYPTNAAGYTLQSRCLLGNGAAWQTVSNSAVVNGTNWNVTLPVTGTGACFRLQSSN
jgi:hypothetical protein